VGFNATRRYRDGKWSDIGLLVAGIVVVGVMILWAVGVIG
jgi:hypothetical protein